MNHRAIILGIAFSIGAHAQVIRYVTIAHANTNVPSSLPAQLNLSADQAFSYVGWTGGSPILSCNCSGGQFQISTPTSAANIWIYSGATNIVIASGVPNTTFATATIALYGSGATVSNYIPADCVVIPSSATGNVQIILESSPDLVNWTAAMPGTYGPSAATNRFFRVRAVAN